MGCRAAAIFKLWNLKSFGFKIKNTAAFGILRYKILGLQLIYLHCQHLGFLYRYSKFLTSVFYSAPLKKNKKKTGEALNSHSQCVSLMRYLLHLQSFFKKTFCKHTCYSISIRGFGRGGKKNLPKRPLLVEESPSTSILTCAVTLDALLPVKEEAEALFSDFGVEFLGFRFLVCNLHLKEGRKKNIINILLNSNMSLFF